MMRIEMLKLWLFGRARFQVWLLDECGRRVKLLADDCTYGNALDQVVRWKAKNGSAMVPVRVLKQGLGLQGDRLTS